MSPPSIEFFSIFALKLSEILSRFTKVCCWERKPYKERHEDPPPPFFDGQHRIVGIISQFFCCLRYRRLDPLSVLYVQNTIIDAPFSQECVCPLFSISFIPKNCWKMRKWSPSKGERRANPSRALAKFLPSRSLKEHVETEDPATSGGIKEARLAPKKMC